MRFAIIGCGEAGGHRAAAIDAVEGAEVAVCVDAVPDRAESLAARHGGDASTDWRASVARSDIDAVVVATANNLHAPVALAAAESGKHLLCERPLARNTAEAEQMVRAARERGVRLKTGLPHRHHPAVAKARELVIQGRIGRTAFLRGRTGRGSYAARPAEWLIDPELSGGGTLLDNGTDLLDLCRYFMGDFRTVFGHTATLVWPIEPVEDNAFAILTTADGRAAIVHSSWSDWEGYLYLDISGSEGYVRVNYDESTVVLGSRPGAAGPALEEVFDLSGEPDRSAEIEIQELMAAVREGRDPAGSGYDGLEALILACAIYRSSDEGHAVRV